MKTRSDLFIHGPAEVGNSLQYNELRATGTGPLSPFGIPWPTVQPGPENGKANYLNSAAIVFKFKIAGPGQRVFDEDNSNDEDRYRITGTS
jgi:hypothetical protein